jgi:hypothetical protein
LPQACAKKKFCNAFLLGMFRHAHDTFLSGGCVQLATITLTTRPRADIMLWFSSWHEAYSVGLLLLASPWILLDRLLNLGFISDTITYFHAALLALLTTAAAISLATAVRRFGIDSSSLTSSKHVAISARKEKPQTKVIGGPVAQPYDAFLVVDVEATCVPGTDFSYPNEIIVNIFLHILCPSLT